MAFQKSNVPLCQLTPYSLNTFMLFLLEPIASFKNAYPNVNIEVSEKGTQHIIEHIENNQIDIGLITIYEDLIKIAILERLGISFGPDFSQK